MSDLISRQAAIDALEREKTYCTAFRDGYTPINVFEKYNAGLTDGIKALKKLPSAEQENVYCKDCKHRDAESFCEGRGWPMQLVPNDGFCDKGERNEE